MNLRVARHTNNLEKIITFYTTVLNLKILGSFKEHHNYDGVFIGGPELYWHLEFTTSQDTTAHEFDDDDILVFYPSTNFSYQEILKNIDKQEIPTLKAKNPYWNNNGVLIQDPDGFNIVISSLKIKD